MEALPRQLPLPASAVRASVCPLDCPDACSLEVRIEEGRAVAIGGTRVNPVTAGFICAKVRRFPEHVYGSQRILHPAVREGAKGSGAFRRVSWDEALDRIASRMRELVAAGAGESILPISYGGSNGYLSQDTTDARLFYRLGASRLARTVCAAPSAAAAAGLYGKMPGIALPDFARARLIVLWGVNPSVSGIHLVPYIFEALRAGATLVVIDPRRTRLAERAGLHLPVRPGTDLPVALSVIRWLFEEGRADRRFLEAHATGAEELRRRALPWTFARAAEEAGVRPFDLERLARLYADSTPAAIRCGWGVERNRNGGSAVAAILALPAVAGKFGVRGGGYTMSNSGAWDLSSLAAAAATPPRTREVNMNRLGETLLEASPPVRLLFSYNANPLATLPNQEKVRAGLLREDLFTVVFDPVLTDTARYADVLLPATTFLERPEMSRGYGAFILQRADASVAPVGEARANHDVFGELCRRSAVARPDDLSTAEELATAILRSSASAPGLSRALESGTAIPPSGEAPVQFVDVFPRTRDRKVHLVPKDLDREAPLGLYGYQRDPARPDRPLALISPASDETISSTLGELRRDPVPLEMNPGDARARGIENGDPVRVFNELGSVECLVRLSEALAPGVALLHKGLWSHNTSNGATANALVPDSLTDLGGGACFNDARVEVERRPLP